MVPARLQRLARKDHISLISVSKVAVTQYSKRILLCTQEHTVFESNYVHMLLTGVDDHRAAYQRTRLDHTTLKSPVSVSSVLLSFSPTELPPLVASWSERPTWPPRGRQRALSYCSSHMTWCPVDLALDVGAVRCHDDKQASHSPVSLFQSGQMNRKYLRCSF